MNIIIVNSHEKLLERLPKSPVSYLLLYKGDTEKGICALHALRDSKVYAEGVQVLATDVAKVRDIHTHYNITTAPTLLEFRGTHLVNQVKGCHPKEFYEALIEKVVYETVTKDTPQKRVTVYSTPTCPWCDTLKNYLRKNRIRFNEVDVSRDSGAAQAMVARSGQQGVPQTDVEGEIVIGFDQARLKKLLNIQSN